MVASVDGEETHNTTCTDDVAEGWNRTVKTSTGTATYIGQADDGTYLFLTASHVTTSDSTSFTISTSDGTSYSYSYAGTSWQLTNSDGSNTDLKIVAVTGTTTAATSYLDSLGSISVYTGSLSQTTSAYTVGTGYSISVGSSYTGGSRVKQWAEFSPNAFSTTTSGAGPNQTTTVTMTADIETYSGTTTTCYVEIFTETETISESSGFGPNSTTTTYEIDSFQGAAGDSGSGVFVEVDGETYICGVLLAIAAYQGDSSSDSYTVGYYEGGTENVYCYTYFADLSVYADQIATIMAIPEPSAFGFLAGTFALAFCAARSRRRRSRRAA